MNATTRLAAAVLVAVVAIGGAIYLLGRGPSVGPAVSNPASSATSAAVPTPFTDTSTWVPFNSTVFGYDVLFPAGWDPTAGTKVASAADIQAGTNAQGGNGPFADRFQPPAMPLIQLSGTSTLVPAGMTEDAWVTAYRQPFVDQFGAACFPPRDQWENVSVDGHPGGMYVQCLQVEATIFVAGRAYIFTYAPGAGVGSEAKTMFRAFLSTVTFHPELAVVATSTPS